jgi:hypothetical protein
VIRRASFRMPAVRVHIGANADMETGRAMELDSPKRCRLDRSEITRQEINGSGVEITNTSTTQNVSDYA